MLRYLAEQLFLCSENCAFPAASRLFRT